MQRAKAILASLLPYLGMAALALWAVTPYFITTSPTSPNAATGNVIPFNQHGVTVYITSGVYWLLYGIAPGAVIAYIIGYYLLVTRSSRA